MILKVKLSAIHLNSDEKGSKSTFVGSIWTFKKVKIIYEIIQRLGVSLN